MKPLILVNFKVYPESTGRKGERLAKTLGRVKSKKYEIGLAPSLLDIQEISRKAKGNIFAQHAEGVELGAHTGSIPLKQLKESGVRGIILNHSERRIAFLEIRRTVELSKKEKLITVVCAGSLWQVKRMAKLKPDYIAYEPRKLIGGDISVTKVQPKIIIKAVQAIKKRSYKTSLLCGAGVHNKEDLGQALLLGAEGVLIAHALIKAKNPEKYLKELLI